MGSIFRRPGKSKKWFVRWKDHAGRTREKGVATDKSAARKFLSERETEAAQRRAGLWDEFAQWRELSIYKHLDDFMVHVEARRGTAKNQNDVNQRLLRALESMRVRTVADLDHSKAEKFLLGLQKIEKLSAKTRDDYCNALQQFGKWLEWVGRVDRDPFRRLKRVQKESDVTFVRQALTLEQLVSLTAAAPVRSVQGYRKTHHRMGEAKAEKLRRGGERRALLYWFAGLTGLRANECRQLRWADLELDEKVLTVRAETSKNRKRQFLPLHPRLVRLLRAERRTQAKELGRPIRASESVLHVPTHVVEQLRKDAKWVDIPVIDDQERRLDFHSLRGSCATILARLGVSRALVQRILRHSDPRITDRLYTKLDLADLHEAIAAIPDEESEGSAGGSTDDSSSPTNPPTRIVPDGADEDRQVQRKVE